MKRVLDNKMTRESITTPTSGVYYVVPKSRTLDSWKIVFQRADDGIDEPLHFDLWRDFVVTHLAQELNLSADEVSKLNDNYTGLPRGRVIADGNKWVIAHGDDSKQLIYSQVLAAFGLLSVNREKLVSWVVDDHEKMNIKERDTVFFVLGKDCKGAND